MCVGPIAVLLWDMALASSSACKPSSFAPDPAMLRGSRCFDWDTRQDDQAIADIYAFRERIRANAPPRAPVVVPVYNWPSAQVVAVATNVILAEVLGYETQLVYPSDTSVVYACVAGDPFCC